MKLVRGFPWRIVISSLVLLSVMIWCLLIIHIVRDQWAIAERDHRIVQLRVQLQMARLRGHMACQQGAGDVSQDLLEKPEKVR